MDKFIKCPKCERLLRDGAKYCGYCGTKWNPESVELLDADSLTAKDYMAEFICDQCSTTSRRPFPYCKKCGGRIIINTFGNNNPEPIPEPTPTPTPIPIPIPIPEPIPPIPDPIPSEPPRKPEKREKKVFKPAGDLF